jgi:hypothetical protein
VGLLEGELVGNRDGAFVLGILVGLTDGKSVGTTLGFGEGKRVGSVVGIREGQVDGN